METIENSVGITLTRKQLEELGIVAAENWYLHYNGNVLSLDLIGHRDEYVSVGTDPVKIKEIRVYLLNFEEFVGKDTFAKIEEVDDRAYIQFSIAARLAQKTSRAGTSKIRCEVLTGPTVADTNIVFSSEIRELIDITSVVVAVRMFCDQIDSQSFSDSVCEIHTAFKVHAL
ncbi:MAG: hypothetical protein AB197_00885 [Parcubacteria bacterium C7867-002]|nr:MAG: hypothetical protein AB197_00885 [Parcubacteria bacterium C7867-002]